MNPWPFVIAAYAVTLTGAAAIALASYLMLRKSER